MKRSWIFWLVLGGFMLIAGSLLGLVRLWFCDYGLLTCDRWYWPLPVFGLISGIAMLVIAKRKI